MRGGITRGCRRDLASDMRTLTSVGMGEQALIGAMVGYLMNMQKTYSAYLCVLLQRPVQHP
jgi:hypothetical protein